MSFRTVHAQEIVPPFLAPVVYPSTSSEEGYPYRIAIGDLIPDESGANDVVVVNGGIDLFSCTNEEGVRSIRIYRNRGPAYWNNPATALEAVAEIVPCGNCQPYALAEVAIGDIDADGLKDIVVSSGDGTPDDGTDTSDKWGLWVIKQTAPGVFETNTHYFTDRPVRGLEFKQMGGTSLADVALASEACVGDADKVYVFKNSNGVLSLAAEKVISMPPYGIPWDLTVNDFNRSLGDISNFGKMDVFTSDFGATQVTLLTHRFDFNFDLVTTIQTPCPGGYSFSSVVSEKFNADDNYDVAGVEPSGQLRVLYGNGATAFSTNCNQHIYGGDVYTLSPTGEPAPQLSKAGVAVGKLNSGPRFDLAAVGGSAYSVTILLGILGPTSAGKFQLDRTDSRYFIDVDPGGQVSYPIQVALEDLNGDGFDDIVTANHHSHNISVVINALTVGP